MLLWFLPQLWSLLLPRFDRVPMWWCHTFFLLLVFLQRSISYPTLPSLRFSTLSVSLTLASRVTANIVFLILWFFLIKQPLTKSCLPASLSPLLSSPLLPICLCIPLWFCLVYVSSVFLYSYLERFSLYVCLIVFYFTLASVYFISFSLYLISYAMHYENLLRHQHQLLYIKEQVITAKPSSVFHLLIEKAFRFCLDLFTTSIHLRKSSNARTQSRPTAQLLWWKFTASWRIGAMNSCWVRRTLFMSISSS